MQPSGGLPPMAVFSILGKPYRALHARANRIQLLPKLPVASWRNIASKSTSIDSADSRHHAYNSPMRLGQSCGRFNRVCLLLKDKSETTMQIAARVSNTPSGHTVEVETDSRKKILSNRLIAITPEAYQREHLGVSRDVHRSTGTTKSRLKGRLVDAEPLASIFKSFENAQVISHIGNFAVSFIQTRHTKQRHVPRRKGHHNCDS